VLSVTTQAWLLLNQGNDEFPTLALTKSDGTPYNLAGATVEMYVKPSAVTPDDDTRVLKLSTATGEITVTDATGGLATVNIAAADLAIPVARYYRADIIASGSRHTALFGVMSVQYTGIVA
jgi:hypothetical protein